MRLVWEDLHLLDLADLFLILANVKRLKNIRFNLIDALKLKHKHPIPLCLTDAAHGVGIIVLSEFKHVKKNGKGKKRLWFVEWSFTVPHPVESGDEMSYLKSFIMLVDPEECENFGLAAYSYVTKLHEELFLLWSNENKGTN